MDSAITLKAESQQALLHFARDTVQNQCLSAHAPSPSRALRAQIPARAGAFVTLKIGKALRGCIGTFDANRALVDVVHEMAIAASTRDPRFHPVRKEELAQLHFAISVLGPPRPVVSLEEIVVGRHGLIVGLGRQRGVLLAKVPWSMAGIVTSFYQ